VNADPDPALKMNADPVSDPDPGHMLKNKKIFEGKLNVKF
jgi:hypothetical protein